MPHCSLYYLNGRGGTTPVKELSNRALWGVRTRVEGIRRTLATICSTHGVSPHIKVTRGASVLGTANAATDYSVFFCKFHAKDPTPSAVRSR